MRVLGLCGGGFERLQLSRPSQKGCPRKSCVASRPQNGASGLLKTARVILTRATDASGEKRFDDSESDREEDTTPKVSKVNSEGSLMAMKKAELQAMLAEWGTRTTGTKVELVKLIRQIQSKALEKSMSIEEFAAQEDQMASLPAIVSPSGPPMTEVLGDIPTYEELAALNINEMKRLLNELGLTSRGNKPDLLFRLTAHFEEKNAMSRQQAAEMKREEERVDNLLPAMKESELARRDAELYEAAQLRKEKEAELQLLTVSEIRNLMRKRRLAIGMHKRKSDLIEKLLDSIYPMSPSGFPMLDTTMEQGMSTDFAARRKELIALIQKHLPGWSPLRDEDDFQYWPLLELQRAAAEQDLSMSGTRAELVARLTQHYGNLQSQLQAISDEDVKRLLFWFNESETPTESSNPREQLAEMISNFPWFAAPVAKYDNLELMSPHPFVDTRLQDPSVYVAILVDLTGNSSTSSSLASVQSIWQDIDLSYYQEVENERGGVAADVFFVNGESVWFLDPCHLHVQSDVELRLVLQEHGQAIKSWEEFEDMLKKTRAVVLPIGSDSNRSLMQKLETASLLYLGASYTSGSLASNKAELNKRLRKLGYPAVPQLSLGPEDLQGLTQSEDESRANEDSPPQADVEGQADGSPVGGEDGELPTDEIELTAAQQQLLDRIETWMIDNNLDGDGQAFVAKPACGALSDGVTSALTSVSLLERVSLLHASGVNDIVLEPFLRDIMEFSVTVVDTPSGPRAFMPLEIEIDDPELDFIDSELEVQKFFATVEGWTDEAELAQNMIAIKEETITSNPHLVMYDLEKKLSPDSRVKIRSPPRLDTDVIIGIRDAAVKAFRDLGLRDYARIDGYIQFPPKPFKPEEKPEELDEYTPPTVDELAPRLRPSDNSSMIPPWDPPTPPDDIDEEPAWMTHLVDDPNFEHMGPYTDPDLASQYHSGGFELVEDGFDENGRPKVKISERHSEQDEVLPWSPAMYEGQTEYLNTLSDKQEWRKPRKDLVGKSWQEKAEILAPQPDDPLKTFTPNYSAIPAEEMCRFGDATVLITDVNVSPPLDQDSLVFKSAAQAGVTPNAFFRHLISNTLQQRRSQPLPWRAVASIKETILQKQEFPKSKKDWDNLPPVTEYERALPWYHERFAYKEPEDEEEGDDGPYTAPGISATGETSASDDDDFTDDLSSLEGPLAKELASEPNEGQGEEPPQIIERPRFTWNVPPSEAAEAAGEWTDRPLGIDPGQGQASTSGRELPGFHPEEFFGPKQRVWILCGGAGSGADMSLESGINIYNILKNQIDLIVELFLVSRPCGGVAEKERRRALLNEHVTRVKIGSNPDINQPPELQLPTIRNPPLPFVELNSRHTWCLPCHLLLNNSAQVVQEACEWTVSDNSQIERLAESWQYHSETLRHLVRDQLLQSGVVDAGSGWGVEREVVAPVCIDVYELMVRANFADATIVNLLQGDVGEDGQLQTLCDSLGTAYVGSGAFTSSICYDRMALADALADVDLQVIDMLPRCEVETQLLIDAVLEDEPLEPLLEEAFDELGLQPGDPMLVRPSFERGNLGTVRLDTIGDLETYAASLSQRHLEIPTGFLSWGNAPIQLPAQTPETCVLEPFIRLDNLQVRQKDGLEELEVAWISPHHVVEVEINVVGVKGRMQAFMPAIFARTPPTTLQIPKISKAEIADETEQEEDNMTREEDDEGVDPEDLSWQDITQEGQAVALCPPPAHILSPEALTGLREKAETVAKYLELSGIASITGFMNTDTGNLTISDVNTVPDLRPGSLLFKQAWAEDPPIMPHQLLRRVVYQSLIEQDEASESNSGFEDRSLSTAVSAQAETSDEPAYY